MGDFLKIADKLKLGKHFRMERFALSFIVLFIGLSLVTGMCFVSHVKNQDTTITTRALYTTKFTTSKTQVTGTVEQVYVSNDKTRTFLLLHFDDINKVSANANKYQAFLTGADVERNAQTLKSEPSGSIYMFGNSGYMGVYLVNTEGFPAQILDLTIRCNSELVASESQASDEMEDASFAKYDQFRVNFNPGATETVSLDCLNDDKAPSVKDLYNQSVVVSATETMHEALRTDMENMRVALNQIDEYEDRLSNTDNVQVPERPELIKGDTIDKDDKDTVETEDDEYMFKPNSVVRGGYDFDWQGTTIEEGYLDDLIKATDTPTMTHDQFFAMKNAELLNSNSMSDFTSNLEWMLKDGTKVADLNTGSNSGRYTTINADCQSLVTAWNTYYQAKTKYQVQDLGALLSLEADASLIESSASINTDSKVLLCY